MFAVKLKMTTYIYMSASREKLYALICSNDAFFIPLPG